MFWLRIEILCMKVLCVLNSIYTNKNVTLYMCQNMQVKSTARTSLKNELLPVPSAILFSTASVIGCILIHRFLYTG